MKKTKTAQIEEQMENKMKRQNWCRNGCGKSGSAIYGLGLIGALIYYISTATSFGTGIIGVLKALIWPVFLVLELFKFLGM